MCIEMQSEIFAQFVVVCRKVHRPYSSTALPTQSFLYFVDGFFSGAVFLAVCNFGPERTMTMHSLPIKIYSLCLNGYYDGFVHFCTGNE